MNPFRMRARERRHKASADEINERYRASIAVWEDARGVVRFGLNPRQWRRRQAWLDAADAGLEYRRLMFVRALVEAGKIDDR